MNLQLINLGTVANDRTGDTIRAGGQKINNNAQELFFFNSARHRQSALVYRATDGQASFLQFAGVNVTLLGPFVGSIAGMNDGRGERNLPVFVQGTAANAWTVQPDGITWIFISSEPNTGVVAYGTTSTMPANQQTAPAEVTGQYWYDNLEGCVKMWDGSAWVQVYVLFLAEVAAVGGSIVSLNYLLDNDETLMARAEATKAAIVLG